MKALLCLFFVLAVGCTKENPGVIRCLTFSGEAGEDVRAGAEVSIREGKFVYAKDGDEIVGVTTSGAEKGFPLEVSARGTSQRNRDISKAQGEE